MPEQSGINKETGTHLTREQADAIALAFKSHGFEDWYHALFASALDETKGDVLKAIELANEAYKRQPKDPDNAPQPDDAEAVFGKDVIEAAKKGKEKP